MPSGCRPDWFVAATYPKAEHRAYAALHLKGYRPWLPLITVRTPKREYRTIPIWPGYVFLQLDLAHPWYPIRFAPGVFQLLAIDGKPTPCAKGLPEAVDAVLAERAVHQRETPQLAPGLAVAVAKGMLEGHHAVVLAVGREKARIAIMLFGALREATVALNCLKPRD
jgi:transcription antitermination factor NusG